MTTRRSFFQLLSGAIAAPLCVGNVGFGCPTPREKLYIGPKGHVRLGTSPPSQNLYIANPNHNPPKQ